VANSKRSAEKEAFWRMAIEEQATSGLSVREFCRREGIAEASFFAWRREIRRRDGSVDEAAELVPVQVVDKLSPATVPSSETGGLLEIVTPSGFTLRLDDHIEPAQLRALLQTIATCGAGVATC
jgi:transposase